MSTTPATTDTAPHDQAQDDQAQDDAAQGAVADPSCTVCPHTWSEHDALGRRFCTATSDVGWSRGCICPAGTT